MGDGKGLPWGPMDYGRPDDVKLETNPYALKGVPDLGPQRQAMLQNIAHEAGGAQNSAMAGLQRMGVGGSEAGAALGNIAGQSAQNIAQGEAGLNQQDFSNRMSLEDAINKARLQKYGIDSGNYNNEQNQRGQAVGALTSLPFQLGGAYTSFMNAKNLGKIANPEQ